jgi:hypothetical protein
MHSTRTLHENTRNNDNNSTLRFVDYTKQHTQHGGSKKKSISKDTENEVLKEMGFNEWTGEMENINIFNLRTNTISKNEHLSEDGELWLKHVEQFNFNVRSTFQEYCTKDGNVCLK